MKAKILISLSIVALMNSSALTYAQNEPASRSEGQAIPDRAGGRSGQQRGDERPRFVTPIIEALDTDGDGSLSAKEIAGASAALKKLDKNGDGKLTDREFRLGRAATLGGRRGLGRERPGRSATDGENSQRPRSGREEGKTRRRRPPVEKDE